MKDVKKRNYTSRILSLERSVISNGQLYNLLMHEYLHECGSYCTKSRPFEGQRGGGGGDQRMHGLEKG